MSWIADRWVEKSDLAPAVVELKTVAPLDATVVTDLAKYTIDVRTSSEVMSETDSCVYIKLCGEIGETELP